MSKNYAHWGWKDESVQPEKFHIIVFFCRWGFCTCRDCRKPWKKGRVNHTKKVIGFIQDIKNKNAETKK